MRNCIDGINPWSCDAALVSIGRVDDSTLLVLICYKNIEQVSKNMDTKQNKTKQCIVWWRTLRRWGPYSLTIQPGFHFFPSAIRMMQPRATVTSLKDALNRHQRSWSGYEEEDEEWLFSLSPSVFARLYLRLHGYLCGPTLVADQRWCCITVFSHVGIIEKSWMFARVGLSGGRCFLHLSLNHKRHLICSKYCPEPVCSTGKTMQLCPADWSKYWLHLIFFLENQKCQEERHPISQSF